MSRSFAILSLGFGLMLLIDECSPQAPGPSFEAEADTLIFVHRDDSERVFCQPIGNRRSIYKITESRVKNRYASGRVSLEWVTDTVYMGSISMDMECPRSLWDWQHPTVALQTD